MLGHVCKAQEQKVVFLVHNSDGLPRGHWSDPAVVKEKEILPVQLAHV